MLDERHIEEPLLQSTKLDNYESGSRVRSNDCIKRHKSAEAFRRVSIVDIGKERIPL